ncbi:MAG: N-acetylmuramoyl-L-alanine amidase, partial [Phycisphaerae bacterium]|nr:N-acetylmuramoyl-L-alanine amidase [Phycisphaerae bacterium]
MNRNMSRLCVAVSILMAVPVAFGQSGSAETGTVVCSTADWPITGVFTLPDHWPVELVLPVGVDVLAVDVVDGVATVSLSEGVLPLLSEAALANLYKALSSPLTASSDVRAVRLTCQGELLSSYLGAAAPVSRPASMEASGPDAAPAVAGLSGLTITIGPSHGYTYGAYGWGYQRPETCGLGELIREDLNSIRLMQFLHQYLTQDDATVYVCRELDETNCCNDSTGFPWWKMAAYCWVRHLGAPCDVWAAYSGDCSGEESVNRNSDDVRARPLYADYVGSDIYIAHHTNAFDGTVSGTEVYRDTAMEHPEHVTASYNLALAAKTEIEAAIRQMYDADWPDRNSGLPRDSAGAFGEIRVPNQPACLIELAFHDNCTRDALYLTDNFFRSVTQWGLYKGICSYFGRTVTWDQYSCEYVSDTIPSLMDAGQTYSVSITLRNRGVLWDNPHGFKLGAVDDSDPFTSFNRVDVTGEARPGNTYTFTFDMTAPGAPGTYTTDWQMVREGVAWFGPIHSEQIEVEGTGPYDAAALVSDTLPTDMRVGERATVSITFENTGTITWTKATGHKLGAVGGSDDFTPLVWIELDDTDSIAPGQQKTFTIPDFTAPQTAGTYVTDWRMYRDGANWFGETLIGSIDVSYAPFWIQTHSLPQGLTDHGVVYLNGYVYSLGGRSNVATAATDVVYYAAVNTDGSIAAW